MGARAVCKPRATGTSRGRWMVAVAMGFCFGGLAATVAPPAAASAQISEKRVLPYPFDMVWPTAVRYLRVDRGYAVRDADPEVGYILFEFPLEGDRTGSGSLEAFRTTDAAGRPSVQVKVTTGAGPLYLPNSILRGLADKVRAERGQPPPPPPKDPPKDQPAPPDDGSPPLVPPAQDPDGIDPGS